MKELKHDNESYIITIRRKGDEPAAHKISSSAPRMATRTYESEPAGRTSVLRDPQIEYESLSSDGTEITAPLPGIIVAVKVKAGDIVREGQEVAVLEAMKMENSIESPRSGTVLSISVSVGDTVKEGTVLIIIA